MIQFRHVLLATGAMISFAHAQTPFQFSGTSTGVAPSSAAIPLSAAALNAAGALKADASALSPLQAKVDAAYSLAIRTGDVLNVRAFGAKCDGSDDTAAIQAALSKAAAAPYNAVVYSPGGRCFMNAALMMSIASAGVKILGDGPDASEWVFSGDTDGLDVTFASGGWWLRNNGASLTGASVEISGLGFVTNNPTASGLGTGTAIKVLGDNVTGRPGPNTSARNVAFRGLGGSQGWARGIYMFQVANHILADVKWTGKNQSTAGIAIEIAGTPVSNEATGIVIENPTATFADVAIKIGPGIQGVSVVDPNFTAVNYGVDWEIPAGQLEDGLFVTGGYIGYNKAAVKTANIYDLNVHHNYFLPAAAGTTAVQAANAGLLSVTGNTVRGSFRPGEAFVYASRDSTVPVQYGSLIADNVVSNMGGTTIQFGPGYVGPLTIGNNAFNSNALDYDEANLPVGVTVLANSRLGATVIGAPNKATIIQGIGSISLGTLADANIVHNAVADDFLVREAASTSGDMVTCTGTKANGADVYPKYPFNHKVFTFAIQCAVTAFSATTEDGTGLAVNSYPTSLAAGSSYSVIFEASGNAWYRWH